MPVRLLAAVSMVVVLSGSVTAVFTAPASATPSCTPGGANHIYDVAWYCATNTGISGTWSNANLSITNPNNPNAGFATSELWDYTNPNGDQFIEMGMINANDSSFGWYNPAGNVQAYQIFWGDESGTGQYYFHWLSNLSPSSSSNAYAVTSTGSNNRWTAAIDFAIAGTSTVQVTSTGWQAATGSDIRYPDFGDVGGTFGMGDGISVNYSFTNPAFNGFYISPGWVCNPAVVSECFNAQIPSNDVFNWNFGNQT